MKWLIMISIISLLTLELLSMNIMHYYDNLPKMEQIRNDDDLRNSLIPLESYNHQGDKEEGSVSIFLSYNAKHLYIYLESFQDDIKFTDRGYQNGDGLHLTIANPGHPEDEASEFYLLGFAIQPEDGINWQNRFIWYRDIDLAMTRLRETEFNWLYHQGRLSLEILIPWSELHPYHPWHNDLLMGFNICYVKADRGEGKNFAFLRLDKRMQSEQSNRKYVKIEASPPSSGRLDHFAQLDRYNLRENEFLNLNLASYATDEINENSSWKIYSGENSYIRGKTQDLIITDGFSMERIPVDLSKLRPDGYRLNLTIGDYSQDLFFTVLPAFELLELKSNINNLNILTGSKYTLLLMLNSLELKIDLQKWYETAYPIRSEFDKILRTISLSEKRDVIKERRGMMRRGFLSQIDNTIQPYSIYLPEDWDGLTELPLLVYLHGSGQDDTALYNTPIIPKKDFIVLAPYARGTSHAYATEESIRDIIEAIDDLIENYPVDEGKIVLSGFSMGGYGVLNTWYTHQNKFHALALFSAHPDLADKYLTGDHPNFLSAQYNANLTDMDVFVFHGELDHNCPFVLMNDFVNIIKSNGARVKFVVDPDIGHESPSSDNIEQFHLWLRNLPEL